MNDEPVMASAGDVYDELNRLGTDIATLQQLVEKLNSRLRPILGSIDDGGLAKDEPAPRTILGDTIRTQDYTVRATMSVVQEILSALELP